MDKSLIHQFLKHDQVTDFVLALKNIAPTVRLLSMSKKKSLSIENYPGGVFDINQLVIKLFTFGVNWGKIYRHLKKINNDNCYDIIGFCDFITSFSTSNAANIIWEKLESCKNFQADLLQQRKIIEFGFAVGNLSVIFGSDVVDQVLYFMGELQFQKAAEVVMEVLYYNGVGPLSLSDNRLWTDNDDLWTEINWDYIYNTIKQNNQKILTNFKINYFGVNLSSSL
jgi:hypothetical protein